VPKGKAATIATENNIKVKKNDFLKKIQKKLKKELAF